MIRLLKQFLLSLCACFVLVGFAHADVYVRDLGRFDAWRENHLTGYGLVVGLAGSGDSFRSKATNQTLANFLTEFNLSVNSELLQSRNVAVVMLTAKLPPVALSGDKLDVTVSSIGDAKSLLGGTLLLSSLKGPDKKIYALAQGSVSVGGYQYDALGGLQQKNHATVGVVNQGAIVEKSSEVQFLDSVKQFKFVLSRPSAALALKLAQALNMAYPKINARPINPSVLLLDYEPYQNYNLIQLLAMLQSVKVNLDGIATIVLNERTGIVIAGGDATVLPVSIVQGNLMLRIESQEKVSQPVVPFSRGSSVLYQQRELNVDEGAQNVVVLSGVMTVADLIVKLNQLKMTTREMIAVMESLRVAGALNAELIVQ